MQQIPIVIVGGGASGLFCAVQIAEKLGGKNILILEAGKRVGTKLLATGNGHCNLTNLRASQEHYHGDVKKAEVLLQKYSPETVMESFQKIGLLCREEGEGRVYPYSMQASSVLNLLRARLELLGVCECCEFEVVEIQKDGNGFLLSSKDNEKIRAQTCILATGGKSSAKFSSGYDLLRQLGHTVSSLKPGLCPILVEEQQKIRTLKGIRARGMVTLRRKGKVVACTMGEIQFTAQGLSGICIFDLSGKALPGDLISLDLAPEYDVKTLKLLAEACDGSLQGVLPKALAAICTPEDCKHLQFTVQKTAPFQNAQITVGGVPLDEIDESCESRKVRGLWILGELLNLNGDCGGFNLHWAWITAMAAAEKISREGTI